MVDLIRLRRPLLFAVMLLRRLAGRLQLGHKERAGKVHITKKPPRNALSLILSAVDCSRDRQQATGGSRASCRGLGRDKMIRSAEPVAQAPAPVPSSLGGINFGDCWCGVLRLNTTAKWPSSITGHQFSATARASPLSAMALTQFLAPLLTR